MAKKHAYRKRQVICLIEAQPRTLQEIAELLSITLENAAICVYRLRDLKVVKAVPGKSNGRRGRPTATYELAVAA